jgi:hypothetical protein
MVWFMAMVASIGKDRRTLVLEASSAIRPALAFAASSPGLIPKTIF